MNHHEFESRLKDFNLLAAYTEKHLTNFIALLNDQKVPSDSDIEHINSCFTDLKQNYDEIVSFAREQMTEDELPEIGSGIGKYAEAVKTSRAAMLRRQMEKASQVLSRFIRIKAKMEVCAQALLPDQQKALRMMDTLSEETVDSITADIEKQELFLSAVDIPDLNNNEGFEVLRKISEFYSYEVQWGLLGNQFYESKENEAVSKEPITAEPSEPADPDTVTEKNEVEEALNTAETTETSDAGTKEAAKDQESVTETQEEVSQPIFEEPVTEQNETEDPVSIQPVKDDSVAESAQEETVASSEKAEPVTEQSEAETPISGKPAENASMPESAQEETLESSEEIQQAAIVPKIITPVNKLRTGNPSAQSFVKEIAKIGRINVEVAFVLPVLTHLGALTADQLYGFGVCFGGFIDDVDRTINTLEKCLDALSRKGFVACYSCGESDDGSETENVYCLSEYCYNCLRKDTISKQFREMWYMKFGKNRFVGRNSMDQNELMKIVSRNEKLLRYVSYEKSALSEDDFEALQSSVKFDNGHYIIATNDRGRMVDCYFAVDPEECDSIEAPLVLVCTEENKPLQSVNPRIEELFLFSGSEITKYCYSDGILLQEPAVTEEAVEPSSPDEIPEVKEDEGHNDSDVALEMSGTPERDPAEPEQLSELEKMLRSKEVPSDEMLCEFINEHLNQPSAANGKLKSTITETVLFADTAALIKNRPDTEKLAAQLKLSTHLLADGLPYNSDILSTYFSNPEKDDPALTLSAYLFAMLTPVATYDYGLRDQTADLFSDFEYYFENLDAFKPLFNKMLSLQNIATNGFSPAVVSLLGSESESKAFIEKLKGEAENYLNVLPPKTRMKVLPVLYGNCFGSGSDLYECMSIISRNNEDSVSVEYVETVLSEYCDRQDETLTVNTEKIDEHVSMEWDKVVSISKFKLEYGARTSIIRQFGYRLELMRTWLEQMRNLSREQDIARLRVIKQELISLCADIQKDDAWKNVPNSNVLAWLLEFIPAYLNGSCSNLSVYSDLLLTGYVPVRDDGTPDIDPTMTEIRYYEPWRNILRHIAAEKKTADEVKDAILGDITAAGDAGWLKDSLHQLKMLGKFIGSTDDDYVVVDSMIKEATESAEERTTHFQETLELAYTYNQINEIEKETLLNIMVLYKPSFYSAMEFANWGRFLDALESQIKEYAAGRRAILKAKLEIKLAENPDSELLLEASRLLEEDVNLAVAEEFMNRYDAGETELEDGSALIIHEKDYFADFLDKRNYDRLLEECRRHNGHALKSFGWAYADKNLPPEWTRRLRDDTKLLITNWPPRQSSTNPEQLKTLFNCLGFNVTQVRKASGYKDNVFKMEAEPVPNSMADYRHPIAAFGTRLKSPIDVIVLYGNYTEKQLVDTISSYDLGGISIVLYDRPLEAASRRLIGEIFHTQTSGQNPFLLIDQVLFLYLAMHQVTERIPALLKCTLPYTTYQPFVRDGGSTSDEMFCGRTQELATIIDPHGAMVVYGGRQLGKTALLERAESRCSKPEDKEYAVYVSIYHIANEADVVHTITAKIDKKTNGRIRLRECSTIKEMCAQIDSLLRNNSIRTMRLFIDEVDAFLEAIKDVEYKPIQPLVDLTRGSSERFKFVIAGLHNVCRAKNATENNGPFGQVGTPLCIKPLSPTDALKLLSRPLNYLGFQIDRYPHLETILTNTNYYPGILQFFGYMLVQTLTGQYSKYYCAADGNPPFTLQDDQLGSVMNSSDLNKSIKEKFRMSLDLDPRYFMIARCITMLYHYHEDDRRSGSWLGFNVEEIMGMAAEYKIHCLEKENHTSYGNLLDEMVDMGILSQPETGTYRLRRNSFVDIIGDNTEKLEKEIIVKNEEYLHG